MLLACLISFLRRYVAQVAVVNGLEPLMRSLTDSQLAEQTLKFRDILARNTHRLVWL
jgi:preprotein translocase subunit SecA